MVFTFSPVVITRVHVISYHFLIILVEIRVFKLLLPLYMVKELPVLVGFECTPLYLLDLSGNR